MKKIKYLLVVLLSFLFINGVKANSINKIDMDIYIDQNGTAHVTEVWDAYLDQGTEGYKDYYNIGEANITNYQVSDETKDYTILDEWDTSASFSEKAYKAGINDTYDGVELCFGISEYGSHIYKISYDIEGFVADLTDSQMAYWTLIPSELSSYTNNVYIKIYADEAFADTLDVWGYGNYGGYAYVYDGYIEMSNEDLKSGEYMTILIKFDKGTFNTANTLDNDFNYYYEMAQEGATSYVKSKTSVFDAISSIIETIIIFIFPFAFIIITSLIASQTSHSKYGTRRLTFGETGSKVPKDINMFRDIPCNKDIFRAYWVACNYNLVKKQTDFLGAIILRWHKKGIVKIESNTVGKIFKKEDTTIVFNEATFDIELEQKLYDYMKEASKDGVLESKEFEKWCKNHYSSILNWFNKVIDYETDRLVEEGKIKVEEVKKLGIIKVKEYNVDPSMMEEAKQMAGLKQFFNEFDNMSDKEAIEVMLWEEYLMYAQIFGVAEKVAKQFKKLYPDVITDYDYDSVVFINNISYDAVHAASAAQSRAQSYSSGGGGFSSGGGGGGSFGGGGGGGFR